VITDNTSSINVGVEHYGAVFAGGGVDDRTKWVKSPLPALFAALDNI